MRILFFGFVVALSPLSLAAPQADATEFDTEAISLKQPTAADADDLQRRCAYLGRWGSFHLLGDRGTAAYIMKSGEYFAELFSIGEDDNWWIYGQVPHKTAHNHIAEWAFARFPDGCGRYWVLHRSGDGWRPYERTHSWGQRHPANAGGIGRGPGHSIIDGIETSVTIINATNNDLSDIFVAFVDAAGTSHKSNLYSISKQSKTDIAEMVNSPKKLNEANLAIGVFSKDGSFSLGKGDGLPLSELVYHHCSDGRVAVGIVIR